MFENRIRSATNLKSRRSTRPSYNFLPRTPRDTRATLTHWKAKKYNFLDSIKRHFREVDSKAFYASVDDFLQIQCGKPVLSSFIKEDQLISERDLVDQSIGECFLEFYERRGHVTET